MYVDSVYHMYYTFNAEHIYTPSRPEKEQSASIVRLRMELCNLYLSRLVQVESLSIRRRAPGACGCT